MLAVSQTARHDASAATPDFSSRSSRPSHPDCRCTSDPSTTSEPRVTLPRVQRIRSYTSGARSRSGLPRSARLLPQRRSMRCCTSGCVGCRIPSRPRIVPPATATTCRFCRPSSPHPGAGSAGQRPGVLRGSDSREPGYRPAGPGTTDFPRCRASDEDRGSLFRHSGSPLHHTFFVTSPRRRLVVCAAAAQSIPAQCTSSYDRRVILQYSQSGT